MCVSLFSASHDRARAVVKSTCVDSALRDCFFFFCLYRMQDIFLRLTLNMMGGFGQPNASHSIALPQYRKICTVLRTWLLGKRESPLSRAPTAFTAQQNAFSSAAAIAKLLSFCRRQTRAPRRRESAFRNALE